MEYTYDVLSKKTVEELREIAKGIEHEALKGYTQLNKEHLIDALCSALNLAKHAHHEVVGVDKGQLKAKIRVLKAARVEALEAHDAGRLKRVRNELRRLKRKLRAAMV